MMIIHTIHMVEDRQAALPVLSYLLEVVRPSQNPQQRSVCYRLVGEMGQSLLRAIFAQLASASSHGTVHQHASLLWELLRNYDSETTRNWCGKVIAEIDSPFLKNEHKHQVLQLIFRYFPPIHYNISEAGQDTRGV